MSAEAAKTGLTIGSLSAPLAGAIAGTIIGGPVGTVVGAVAGLVGLGLGLGASAIDPERAAAKKAALAAGTTTAYAKEYAHSVQAPDDYLLQRAQWLYEKVARGDMDAAEGLKAIRNIRAERAVVAGQEYAAQVAVTPRTGQVPVWSIAALLAIMATGVAILVRRRRRAA